MKKYKPKFLELFSKTDSFLGDVVRFNTVLVQNRGILKDDEVEHHLRHLVKDTKITEEIISYSVNLLK